MRSTTRQTSHGPVTVSVGDVVDWGFAPCVPATIARLNGDDVWVTVDPLVARFIGGHADEERWARWDALRIAGVGRLG